VGDSYGRWPLLGMNQDDQTVTSLIRSNATRPLVAIWTGLSLAFTPGWGKEKSEALKIIVSHASN
jgi:hypothetical protein